MSDKATTAPQAQTFTVVEDDDGIRLDRWFKRHLPDVSFNIVSRWARTGQLRLDGKRAVPGDRVEAGQQIRVPPPDSAPVRSLREKKHRKQEAKFQWSHAKDLKPEPEELPKIEEKLKSGLSDTSSSAAEAERIKKSRSGG